MLIHYTFLKTQLDALNFEWKKGCQKSNRDNDEREHGQRPRTRQITVALSPAQGFTLPTPHTVSWDSNHP